MIDHQHASSSKDTDLDNSYLIAIINDFIVETMEHRSYWPYWTFCCGCFISHRQRDGLKSAFASYNPDEEEPLILIDDSFLHNGKKGVMITNKMLYYKLLPIGKGSYWQGVIPNTAISNACFQPRMTGSHFKLNNEFLGVSISYTRVGSGSKECAVINNLLQSLLQAINSNRTKEKINVVIKPNKYYECSESNNSLPFCFSMILMVLSMVLIVAVLAKIFQ